MSNNTELVYREISCQKAVSGSDFARGVQDYNWSVGAPSAWIPSKSYFRATLKITEGAAGTTQPNYQDQLAFADNACSALFNNVYMRAGGQDISSIVNYVPQASSAKMRLQKSGAWLDTVGKTHLLEPDLQKRVNQVSTKTQLDAFGTVDYVDVGDATHFDTATCAITADTGAVAGVNTAFNAIGLAVGDYLVVEGVRYTIKTITDATTVVVNPRPAANIAATADCYALKCRGNDGGARNTLFATFQPPIGIFDHAAPMGSGDYRIQLNPNANFETSIVETLRPNAVHGTDYKVEVLDIKFYVAIIKASIPSGVEKLHLMEAQVQSKTAPASGTLDFTVPSSTRAISIFVQSGTAGANPNLPPTMFKCVDGSEKNLTSLQITYANTTKPSTRWESSFSATDNKLQQRYIDTQIESGMLHNPGGCESFGDWLKRGPLVHYSFAKDSEDRSTQVQLSTTYDALEAGANLFIVAWYTRAVEITTSNGAVVEVRSLAV